MSFPIQLPQNEPLLTITHPKKSLWIIELHNGVDNRLTATLVNEGLKPALDAVERDWRNNWRTAAQTKDKDGGKGALIIVGRKDQDKFFSNGLDFSSVQKDPNFFPLTFNPFLARLLAFPIPTIAAINGHCFAGGFMLAMACDYRIMTSGTKRRAWLSMNEVHFGAVWPWSFAAILRAKFGNAQLQRKIALEGHRFEPKEALDAGILDAIVEGTTKDILAKAEEFADTLDYAKAGVWGLIKDDIYRDTLVVIRQDQRIKTAEMEDAAAKARL